MSGFAPSAWPEADLSALGIGDAGQDRSVLTQHQLGGALNAIKNGQAYLDWLAFQHALAVRDRIAAGIAADKLADTDRKVLDVDAQTVLVLQLDLQGTEYQGRMLLEDALAAHYRLPMVAALLRHGRIDRRRFHKINTETAYIADPLTMALVDNKIAAEILGIVTGGAAISEGQAAEIARRHVVAEDADAARRREAAKARRGVFGKSLDDGLAQLAIVTTAEDRRLAEKAIDAVIAGLCPHDPRTKAVARSESAIAALTGRPFHCQCEREDCTATLDATSIDTRAARIVVHAICDSTTLEGGGKPGHLDGHGPISASHVRELAGRDDATVRRHDLNDLCPNPDLPEPDLPEPDLTEPDQDAVVHRRAPRSETPGEYRGDDRCPDWLFLDEEPPVLPPEELIDDDPGAFTTIEDLEHRDPAGPDLAQLLEAAAARPAPLTDEEQWEEIVAALRSGDDRLASWACAWEAVPYRTIDGTGLPSDPYRATALTDLVCRFLWGTCSIPGCERPAFSCDLDHVTEFNNICPDQGGPTCLCNLLPKCRFHHLAKTHLDRFVDELWIDADGLYRSAATFHGVTVETRAPNQWLFPSLTDMRCRHRPGGEPAVSAATADFEDLPDRARTRTQAKHARRRAERERNRRERETRDTESPGPDDSGDPPY